MSDNFNNPWGNNDKNKPSIDEILQKSQQKFKVIFGDGANKDNGSGFNNGGEGGFLSGKNIVFIFLGLVLLFWLSTGFYTIQADQEGVVLTLGKYSRTVGPGLNYKLPDPFETVTKVSVTRVNKEEIGFRSAGNEALSRAMLLKNTVSSESQMLTMDENIVDINFEIQWQISDAKNFLFNVRDMDNENTVKYVAESAVREVIGLTKITDVLAEERSLIEQKARSLMQDMLDEYKMGVRILRVQLLRVEPPQEVIDAYRDVQNAKQDKQREINIAYAYRNEILPRARGEAEKVLQDADAYKQRVIADAVGEASRFNSIYNQYKNAKDVTRTRMYLEVMEDVMKNVDKIIVDKKASSSMVPYLPLNEIGNNKK